MLPINVNQEWAATSLLKDGCIELCRAALATAMVVHCCIAKRIVPTRVHVAAFWQANCKLSVQPLITSHNQFFDLLTKFFLAPVPTINWYQKTSYRELMGLIYKGARSAANRRQKQIWNPRGPAAQPNICSVVLWFDNPDRGPCWRQPCQHCRSLTIPEGGSRTARGASQTQNIRERVRSG